MGKHNGKARATGMKVGQALARRVGQRTGGGAAGAGKHTTDIGPSGNMQSVLERNDLDELMAMADLADRDFTAEKANVVVISSGAVDGKSAEADAARRAELEELHAHELTIPRRPAWDARTTPDQLDAQEKAAFLDWRRRLAHLEESERLVLTPFERNLEVWRQLWRVLERSDIVVQVVDGRDPLTYFSTDLADAARELHPTKASLVLLNKSDLLPPAVRVAWARHFRAAGIDCAFWSAYAAAEAQLKAKQEAALYGLAEPPSTSSAAARAPAAAAGSNDDDDASWLAAATRVLTVDELLDLMEERAAAAVAAAGPSDPRSTDSERRFMVGLVGYPNVGKSSTINAIFGSKKTAVAPTPGKTKHFQTLNVSASLCLCDCPGLVLPKFARSKSDMVAAGVIPIDRLTDVRAPVQVVADRCGTAQIADVYGIRLPGAGSSSSSSNAAGARSAAAGQGGKAEAAAQQQAPQELSAAQVLLSLAMARGWTAGGGLPDEARAGRQILKDYTGGKLLYCQLPPGATPQGWAPTQAPVPAWLESLQRLPPGAHAVAAAAAGGAAAASAAAGPSPNAAAAEQQEQEAGSSSEEEGDADEASSSGAGEAAVDAVEPELSAQEREDLLLLDPADLELLDTLGLEGELGGASVRPGGSASAKRGEHKFHKKAARSKGDRGQASEQGGYDGAAIPVGKKGGLVRVAGY